MVNPTFLYVAAVYAAAVFLLRRSGATLPVRVAAFFYALVLLFFFEPLTQAYVNVPVDFVKTLTPWAYVTREHTSLNGHMNDIPLQIVPWAHQVRTAWQSFTAPLWNSMSACGYPLLASGQSSALSPLRILGLPLSLGHAMAFEGAMKILIALTFMFLWCRRRGYSELAGIIGAVAFGFCTFLVVWLHFPLVTTACFIPAVFYVIDLIAEKPTKIRFAAGAAVWAVMLFGGHPETVSHTFFVALLYVLWIVVVERSASWRMLLTLGAAMAIAGLLAAPFLAPFAETVRKSKRYGELQSQTIRPDVPFSDGPSALLLLQPHFFGEVPTEPAWGIEHAESITGFAGYLGVTAWFALLAHAIMRRRFRTREMLFVLATVLVVGVVFNWPVISDVFFLAFRFAANARLRLFIAFLLAVQTAAAVDLARRDRTALLVGIAASSALLLYVLKTTPFQYAYNRDTAYLVSIPSLAVLVIATLYALADRRRELVLLVLLVAVVAELWKAGHDWNPVVAEKWMYPKTPLITRLLELQREAKEPYRIAGNGATLFPNTSAMYGLEDVRAHDPMVNARYINTLRLATGYDPTNYFATWNEYEKHFIDFLNVRWVAATPFGDMPARYREVYRGTDGRIFENTEVLPRFFAVRNVHTEFRPAYYDHALHTMEDWSQTALVDKLEIENPQMRSDFFAPRPAGAPVAKVDILSASAQEYRLHIVAPRYTLIASSITWWPGWKVERNGALTTPIKVNGAFLGFAVPPGELDVRVWYDPWSFRLGWVISLTTVVWLIVWCTWKRRAVEEGAATGEEPAV